MASQAFTASQVCQIVTGEDGDLDYMFPGSDDDLDMEDIDDVDEMEEHAVKMQKWSNYIAIYQ